ncbi:hypothetical protein NBH19_08960 [Rhizobium sp. S95]|uniref:Pentapeptide repeat protein n=1 Tax=Ciceribacter sichuanensis TaxID=2949647 RepID=A0AAJ1BWM5_9HYPH|nr:MULTISPECIES: hypothetical protein [unclassified Ciceribacter]MCM2396207.1 hypothetical protein [Ciceribacter sp. S95]MCO5957642.1 hypothetical protein [Ciceribacter sp. S101]
MSVRWIASFLGGAASFARLPFRELRRLDRCLRPARDMLERSALAHLVVIAAGAFTVYQLWVDLDDRRAERVSRREERVERAWNRLITPAGGNTGKGAALNLLLEERQDLVAVDFSCRTIGVWNETEKKCLNPPIFTDIKVPADFLLGQDFEPSTEPPQIPFGMFYRLFQYPHAVGTPTQAPDSFDGVVFKRSDFSRTRLGLDRFANVSFEETDLSGAQISQDVQSVRINNSDLSYATVMSEAGELSITRTNITGLIMRDRMFEWTLFNQQNPFDYNWAWADMPPMRYRETATEVFIEPLPWQQLDNVQLCDPAYRAAPDEGATTVTTTTMGYPNLSTAKGKVAQRTPEEFQIPDIGAASCAAITLAEARDRFPERYPAGP